MSRVESGYLASTPRLYYRVWHPLQQAKGVVLIVHGLGGHGGQFVPPAEMWSSADLAVYTVDLRGHGRSDGRRGYINRWQEYLQDLNQIFQEGRRDYERVPLFLWGHSLGGLIALDYVLKYPESLAGLMLSAPAVGQTEVSPILFTLGRLLSWIWPHFSLNLGFDPDACSRIPEVTKRYNRDPIRHTRGTARLSTEFQKAQARVMNAVSTIVTPTLLLHGGGDRITNPKDSLKLYKAMTTSNCRLIEYPEAYHELHLDLNQAQVMDDMSQWIYTRICGANKGR
ncbi:MAG: lysophospholipase [Cyanobacteria bacterium P01_F01_bin.42]